MLQRGCGVQVASPSRQMQRVTWQRVAADPWINPHQLLTTVRRAAEHDETGPFWGMRQACFGDQQFNHTSGSVPSALTLRCCSALRWMRMLTAIPVHLPKPKLPNVRTEDAENVEAQAVATQLVDPWTIKPSVLVELRAKAAIVRHHWGGPEPVTIHETKGY